MTNQPTTRIKWVPFITFIGLVLLTIALIVYGWVLFLTSINEAKPEPETPVPCCEVVEPKPEVPAELPATGYDGPLSYVNEYRESKGLKPLTLNTELIHSAQAKSDDLIAHDYFSHVRGDVEPWDFLIAAGYDYRKAGENLAKCYDDSKTLVQAWIDSPSHEANLVGDYKEIGFGATKNPANGCEYVTAHFGSRA